MRELDAHDFALMVAIAVSSRRTRMSRHKRRKSEYIDDCIGLLKEGTLSPSVIRYRPGGFDPTEAERRKLCADALEYFEVIAPIVRALEELP